METRIDIINFLSNKFGYKNYLEIGIRNPWECFDHIQCENKDSVDPGFETNDNVAKYKYTSDEFFRVLENGELDKETDFKWDVIFIDGLHTSYQVERDIKNSLNHLSENGTIVLHDCNPPTEYHARADYNDYGTIAGGCWNGTVWKAIYKLRCFNKDVDVCVVDKDWGCGVVRKGSQEVSAFDNPYFDYDLFNINRNRNLNLIDSADLNEWLDSPFYR